MCSYFYIILWLGHYFLCLLLVFNDLSGEHFLIFELRPDEVRLFLILYNLKPKSFLDDGLNQVAIIAEPYKYLEWGLIFFYVKLPIDVVGIVDYE